MFEDFCVFFFLMCMYVEWKVTIKYVLLEYASKKTELKQNKAKTQTNTKQTINGNPNKQKKSFKTYFLIISRIYYWNQAIEQNFRKILK